MSFLIKSAFDALLRIKHTLNYTDKGKTIALRCALCRIHLPTKKGNMTVESSKPSITITVLWLQDYIKVTFAFFSDLLHLSCIASTSFLLVEKSRQLAGRILIEWFLYILKRWLQDEFTSICLKMESLPPVRFAVLKSWALRARYLKIHLCVGRGISWGGSSSSCQLQWYCLCFELIVWF